MQSEKSKKSRRIAEFTLLILTISCWIWFGVFQYERITNIKYYFSENGELDPGNFVLGIIFLGGLCLAMTVATKSYFRRFGSQFIEDLGFEEKRTKFDASSLSSFERSVASEIETLKNDLDTRILALEFGGGGSDDRNEILKESLNQKLEKEFNGDLIDVLGEKVSREASDYHKRALLREEVTSLFDKAQTRINDLANRMEESAESFRKLAKRLAIAGVTVAAINITMFYFGWLNPLMDIDSLADVISIEIYNSQYKLNLIKHISFSASFILLSEVLSLIMFRYQSKHLELMRFFSNEVSALGLKRAGALVTIELGSPEDVSQLAGTLINSERNIILQKGERTIESPQNDTDRSMLDTLSSLSGSILNREKKTNGSSPASIGD